MPDLRKGQYKRIGRIAETNPERAERVAERMKTRASRGERGKNIANKDETENGFARGVARSLYAGSGSAQEDLVVKNQARKLNTAQSEAKEKQSEKGFAKGVSKLYDKDVETKREAAISKYRKRPDTPLADTPEPLFYKK